MSWIRIDDGFISHPKTLQISHKAVVLHIAGLTYCSVQLSDGIIPNGAIPMVLAQARVTRRALTELRDAEMWRDQGEHWEIHDYLDFQESRETVLKRRENARQRKAKSRAESQRDSRRESSEESHDTHPIPSHPIQESGSRESNEAPAQPVDIRIRQAAELYAIHRAIETNPRNPQGFIRSLVADELALNGEAARRFVEENPAATARNVAWAVWGLTTGQLDQVERHREAAS